MSKPPPPCHPGRVLRPPGGGWYLIHRLGCISFTIQADAARGHACDLTCHSILTENPVQRSRARALAGARRAECRRYSQRCSCLPVRAHDPPAQRPRYFGFSFFSFFFLSFTFRRGNCYHFLLLFTFFLYLLLCFSLEKFS